VGKGRACTNTKKRTKWKTLGGTFTTNYESLLDFRFPELSTSKVVAWQAHVDDNNSSKDAAYDMTMGMDLMTFIGIKVDCEQTRCIIHQMSQLSCKKQKRDKIASYMRTTTKLRQIPLFNN
jgi:hypothetical protein